MLILLIAGCGKEQESAGLEWTGFDLELAETFAERIGVILELKEIDWDDKTIYFQRAGGCDQKLTECKGCILCSAVGMEHETTGRISFRISLLKSCYDKSDIRFAGQTPRDHLS